MKQPKHITEAPSEITEAQANEIAKLVATSDGTHALLAVLSGYKPPQPPTRRHLVELLHGVKLPPPIQLAALAAAVGPRDKPEEAVCCALRLFIRATAFLKHHSKDPLPELALAVRDLDLWLAAHASQKMGPLLRLEMDKKSDMVRRYLSKHGIQLKKARSALENLRNSTRIVDMLAFLCHTKHQPPPPQDLLMGKAYHEAVERQALAAGWRKSASELLAIFRERRPDEREVYLVPRAILDSLVAFKKWRKTSGGVKSRQTAAKNLSKTS